jgi:hypothetical protein
MYFLLRLTPILSSVVSFFLLYQLYRPSEWITELLGPMSAYRLIGTVLIVILVYLLSIIFIGAGYPVRARLRFFPFLAILWGAGIGVLSFSEQSLAIWGSLMALPVLAWIWMESLYLFWQRSLAYQANTVQRIASYLYLVGIFLYSVAAVGLQIFMQIPLWLVLVVSAGIYFGVQFDYFMLQQRKREEAIVYSLIGTILSLQLVLVLNLLPTHFFLYGLTIVLFFYTWLGIITQALKRRKDGLKIRMYLTVSATGTLAVFFSALFVN